MDVGSFTSGLETITFLVWLACVVSALVLYLRPVGAPAAAPRPSAGTSPVA